MSSYSVCECGPCWYSPIEHHTDVARACISAESLQQLHPEQRFRVYDNEEKRFVDLGAEVFRTHRYQVYVEIAGSWSPMTRFNDLESAKNWIVSYDPDGTVGVKIMDHEEARFIFLNEIFDIHKKAKKPEEPNGEWKDEGF